VSAAQIYQVLSDDIGFVWAASSRGLLRLPRSGLMDVAEGRARRVEGATLEVSDERRDVAVIGTRQPSCWRTGDGRLWFSGAQGVLTVDPRRVPHNPRPPAVVIDEALVDGRPAHPAGETVFAPGPRRLQFRFAAVTLIEPHKVRHRYRLEGFDDRWIEAGTSRAASYTNIPPGRYRFLVQASNADGVWNRGGAAVAFRLRPAFHRTPWFYALAALALAAGVWLWHRARLVRLRREYLAVFAERTRVARELHDSLLQGMSGAAMQLHALRVQAGAVAPTLTGRLDAIQAGISSSLEETRRYLWELREQDGAAGDLAQALERLARRISQEGTGPVACEVRVEGAPLSLSHEVQGELFRITQEALTNAVKHGAARRVAVELAYDERRVRLTVSDDGPGFDSERALAAPEGRLGLVGMRERASRIGASLEIASAPGAGTTVLVSVPAPGRG
jgi:signal transduction histidine kinase